MVNLLAYMPVVNEQHRLWLARHRYSPVFLITQEMAESILPALIRNIIALPTEMVVKMIQATHPAYQVEEFYPEQNDLLRSKPPATNEWCLADEDISHAVAKKYLLPLGYTVRFENIRARYDMSEVKAAQPVIPDCEVSLDELDVLRISYTDELALGSPDWWRQIGVIAFRGTELLGIGRNVHLPSEYEAAIFGDPRLNFNAGDPTGMDAYISLHAEEYLGAYCAEQGVSLRGASIVINTFPCGRCARFLKISGISELFFREGSSFLKGFEILKGAGVRIVQVRRSPESA